MPVLHSRITSKTYDFLVEKVRLKLSAWKAKILSQAARVLLIKSVLTALPSYVMQTSRIPAVTLCDVDRHIRMFFLG